MTPIMVDTDVLIWVLRGRPEAIHWLQSAAGRGRLACSALTVSEVFRLVRTEELRKTDTLVAGLDVISVTYHDARRAAELMRDRGLGFVDCHIAATALQEDAIEAAAHFSPRVLRHGSTNLLHKSSPPA